MTANPLHDLQVAGQSIWLDHIRRALLTSGELDRYRDELCVTGVTSNPTIFERAISGSDDYDDALRGALERGIDHPEELFWELAVADIADAADVLREVYEASGGTDGYVSLELPPRLSPNAAGSVELAERLAARLDRPNTMIKVPGTNEGLEAIEELTARGINVNVTLLFTLGQWSRVAEAYLRGLERRHAAGAPLEVSSVASFFISRIDATANRTLPGELHNRVAVANAALVYASYRRLLASDRWRALTEAGARPQRLLWASTSAKDPRLDDTHYVAALAADGTVNTMPEQTLFAFAERGRVDATLPQNPATAEETIRAAEVADAQEDLVGCEAVERLWRGDHTLWQDDPTEVADRLGWLHSPERMEEGVDGLRAFTERALDDGFTHALVLGMGGSSLFPLVAANALPRSHRGLELTVLDSIDPGALRRTERELPLESTLVVASSKSGTTAETRSLLEWWWARGNDPERFAVVTDPGTPLATLARDRGFRAVFEAQADIGGRYSALSHYGLVPAALAGVDVAELLRRAGRMAAASAVCVSPERNPALELAAVLAGAARAGRDKLTLIADDPVADFGLWVEQLLAESTGKHRRGIVPIVGEPLGAPEVYGDDRLFIALGGDPARFDALAAAGQPVLTLPIDDPLDLGAEVLRWEIATGLAGAALGLNPFDQPDVEAAKDAARAALRTGVVEPAPEPLGDVLAQLGPRAHLALQAYVDPLDPVVAALQRARIALRDRYRVATSLGIGPRYLHASGQLHKGGPERILVAQVVGDDDEDPPIPGERFGFATLKRAQAAGDVAALRSGGRHAARVDIDDLLELTKAEVPA